MMTKDELELAIKVAKEQLTKLTHETLRPNAGFKMRTHGSIISAIAQCIRFYEEELERLPKPTKARKED